MALNAFRFCGDMCRLLAIIVLIRRLKTANNAQGISLKTHELYLLVCAARYTDLFTTFYSWYNSVMKVTYILLHCCVIYLIRWHGSISPSYDRDLDDFPAKYLVVPSALLAVGMHIIQQAQGAGYEHYPVLAVMQELLWMFSIILESVSIVPQLHLLRKYRVIENLTGNYVFLLGVYRGLYGFNWVYRSYHEPHYRHHYGAYFFGAVQTLLYLDFFYCWLKSKREGSELSYGGEGDADYYDNDVNELRNYDNSLLLMEDDDSNADCDIRRRGTAASNDTEGIA